MKVFVDTNVLIDYLCKREPFFVPAKTIFALCYMGKIEIVMSSLSTHFISDGNMTLQSLNKVCSGCHISSVLWI